jgi:hypothetical protein
MGGCLSGGGGSTKCVSPQERPSIPRKDFYSAKNSNQDPVKPASYTSPVLVPLFPAHRTFPTVHIDGAATGFAGPALPFGFDELADAMRLYRFKVFDHAHAILHPVPFVQLLQPCAGVFTTIVMVPSLHFFTGKNGAALVALTVRGKTPAAMVLLPEIRHADGAVHATGSDQGCIEGVFHCHECG